MVVQMGEQNEMTRLFNTYVTSELMHAQESKEVFVDDVDWLWVVAVVYIFFKLLQLQSVLMTMLVIALWFTTVPLGLLLYRGILGMP
jgi:hypothetical protein